MLWGLSRQSAGKVLRCRGQRGTEEKRKKKTQSYMEYHWCICSENAIHLQPNTACMGKAQFMDIERVCCNWSTVHGGTTPSMGKNGYADWRWWAQIPWIPFLTLLQKSIFHFRHIHLPHLNSTKAIHKEISEKTWMQCTQILGIEWEWRKEKKPRVRGHLFMHWGIKHNSVVA